MSSFAAFVSYHDSLPILSELEAERARADGLEEKLQTLEANGINVDNIPKQKTGDRFQWPKIPRAVTFGLVILTVILTLWVSYAYLGAILDKYLIQADLDQISTLLQTAPASSHAALIQAQSELQKSLTDLQAHGSSAYGEVAKALSDAGDAINQAIQASIPQSPVTAINSTSIAHSLNTNSTSSSSTIVAKQ